MAVTTTKTNKPINPRGNDQSPKGYNRAALYSGKALDFDGANDNISIPLFNFTAGNKYSLCIYANRDNNGMIWSHSNQFIEIRFYAGAVELRTYDSSWNIYTIIDDVPANEWHQIVVTYDVDANIWKSYLNGQFVKSVTAAAALYPRINRIASASGTFYDGEFANAKIFDVALTPAQVADLYNNPEKIVPTGVSNDALKLWLPMMEGAGTYCINGADPLGADEFGGAGSFDSATGWTLNTGFSIGSGSLSCNGTQTAATSAYYNISSVASSLVMVQFTLSNVTAGQVQLAFFGAAGTTTKWYTADGTYTEYVEVQAGHNGNTGFIANADFVGDIDDLTLKVVNTGAISGATWTHGVGSPVAQTAVIDWNKETTGAGTTMLLPQGLTSGRDITGVNLFENVRKQGALNLDGNSWAEVHDNASLDVTDAITLEAWVYLDSAPIDNVDSMSSIMTKKSANVTDSEAAFDVRATGSNGSIAITGGFDTGALQTINIATGLSIDQWYHIGITYDSGSVVTYLNGAQVNTGSMLSPIIANAYDVWIGRHVNAGGLNSYALADIAQPRIYNRALTAEEVERNYNAGKNIYK